MSGSGGPIGPRGRSGPVGSPGPSGPVGSPGPAGAATPYVLWGLLLAGILLVVFGPDTSLGLVGLAAGLVLVVGSLLWWLRSEARRR